jgi:small-conductance mechanosensitive channel
MQPIRYTTVGAIVLAFIVAAVVVRVAHAIIQRLLNALEIVSAENRAAVQARAQQLTRALTVLAYGVAALAAVTLALSRFGINEPRWDPRLLGHWLAATLGGILTSLVTATVAFVAILMLLRELSIDVLPILTGAGIAGLAIGFGAQNLVRDVISGFFLILEDQVRIGDLARINGITGIVEQINLRTIILRDAEGAVQVFPNGTITALANLSKQFAFAIVDVRVAYTENIDRVMGTLREVGASMEHDPTWGALVVGPLEVVGVESLADGAATIRVKFKTLPLNQGRVANELRRRLLPTFVGRGIRPYSNT